MYQLVRQRGAIAPHLQDHVRRPRRTRVRLDLRLIEHDDVSDEDASRFGLERRVDQVLFDA
jgi:hypothetical protein